MKNFVGLLIIATAVICVNAQRSKSALLPADEAKKLAKQCSRPSPDDFSGTWEPTAKQIKTMEMDLNDITKLKVESCCIIGDQVANPDDWYLQYAALIWKGKKIIYVSSVSTEKPRGYCFDKDGIITDTSCEYWKQHAAIVCDGGTQWGVIYDVSTGKFSDLAVNGVG